jgi:hypothetical protein
MVPRAGEAPKPSGIGAMFDGVAVVFWQKEPFFGPLTCELSGPARVSQEVSLPTAFSHHGDQVSGAGNGCQVKWKRGDEQLAAATESRHEFDVVNLTSQGSDRFQCFLDFSEIGIGDDL